MLPTIDEEDYSVMIDIVISEIKPVDIPVLEDKPADRVDRTHALITTVVTMGVGLAIFSFLILATNHDWDTIFAAFVVLFIVWCVYITHRS